MVKNWGRLLLEQAKEASAGSSDGTAGGEADPATLTSFAAALTEYAASIREGRFEASACAGRITEAAFRYQGHAAFPRAEGLLEWGLAMVEEAYGAHDYRVAVCATNLAVLLQSRSPPVCLTPHPKLERAEELLRRSVEITERAYGKRHPELAQRLNNLAMLLRTQGPRQNLPPVRPRPRQANQP